jgi:hypothetical protein
MFGLIYLETLCNLTIGFLPCQISGGSRLGFGVAWGNGGDEL